MSQQHTHNTDQASESDGQASVMSMMSGEANDQPLGMEEEAEGDASGPTINSSLVIIGVVAVVLVGAVVLMRSLQTNELDEGGVSPKLQAKVEQYIGGNKASADAGGATDAGKSIPGMNRNTGSIVAMFSQDFSDKQVPIEFVKKNPFRLSLPEPKQKPQDTKEDKPDPEQQRRKRLAKLRNQADRLTLQSVMGGDSPVAVIDGELYQRGDRVGPFTIHSISRLRVKVKAAGEMFTLTMDDSERR